MRHQLAQVNSRRLPLFMGLALAWLVVADIPTSLRFGSISVSGVATLLAGVVSIVLSPMLLAHGRTRFAPSRWAYVIAPGPRAGVVPLPLIAFCVVVVLGLARHLSLSGVQQVAVYVAFVVVIGFAAVRSQAHHAERFLVLMGIWMGIEGIVSIPLYVENVVIIGNRSFALTGMLAIAALVPLASANRLVRLAPYILTLGIAVSLSRTALVIAVLLLAFAVLRSRHGLRGVRIVLSLAGLAVAAVVAFLAIPELRDRFTSGDNSVTIGGVALNTSGRTEIWNVVIQDALKSPWIGQGAGTASDLVTAKYPFVAQPHNEFLRFWHDFGFLGVGLFVIGYLMLIGGALLRATRTRRESRAIHWSAALALSAVGIAALTDNPFIYPFVMVPLGVLTGLSIARRDIDQLPRQSLRMRRASELGAGAHAGTRDAIGPSLVRPGAGRPRRTPAGATRQRAALTPGEVRSDSARSNAAARVAARSHVGVATADVADRGVAADEPLDRPFRP